MRCSLFLLLLACACSKTEHIAPTQSNTSAITSVDLHANKQGGMVTFDTGRMRGVLTIAPGMETGYEITTQTVAGESTLKTTIKVDGRVLSVEPDSIRIGAKSVGPLSGEVKIEVKADGVYVDGTKKSDL